MKIESLPPYLTVVEVDEDVEVKTIDERDAIVTIVQQSGAHKLTALVPRQDIHDALYPDDCCPAEADARAELREREEAIGELNATNARLERDLQDERERKLVDYDALVRQHEELKQRYAERGEQVTALETELAQAREYATTLERTAYDVEKASDGEASKLRAAVKALAQLVADL